MVGISRGQLLLLLVLVVVVVLVMISSASSRCGSAGGDEGKSRAMASVWFQAVIATRKKKKKVRISWWGSYSTKLHICSTYHICPFISILVFLTTDGNIWIPCSIPWENQIGFIIIEIITQERPLTPFLTSGSIGPGKVGLKSRFAISRGEMGVSEFRHGLRKPNATDETRLPRQGRVWEVAELTNSSREGNGAKPSWFQ